MNTTRPLLVLALSALGVSGLYAQDAATDQSGRLVPYVQAAGHVAISERSDFSRYENGRYSGLWSRQARLELDLSPGPAGSSLYRGDVLLFEESLRGSAYAASLVNASFPVAFSVSAGGVTSFTEDPGYPILRGVPAPPPEPVPVGGRWQGEGVVVVRPRTNAPATRVRTAIQYEFKGSTVWEGRPALSVQASYAVRYSGNDRQGDPNLSSAMGGRVADIVLDPDTGATLFIRERVDETYTYRDGSSVRLKGFILHFHKGSLPGDRAAVAAALGVPEAVPGGGTAPGSGSQAGSAGTGAVATTGASGGGADSGTVPAASTGSTADETGTASSTTSASQAIEAPGGAYAVSQSDRGVVLILFDLRFVADSDQLLAGEKPRLDAIAEALKRIPDRTFLVEGHAADVGKPQGQYQLSEARAKRIVDELVARGIPASRFIYRGLGGDVPLAPNDTEQGRARNRRVEITVLN